MQDNTYDEYDPADDEPSRFSRIKGAVSTAVGALVAMALLLTLGVWFYRLGVRDAQSVPIIRAAIEPAKERPQDPGGLVAPHQDVASYGVADSEGVQASAAVIAPPPPEPRDEDVAMGELTAVKQAPAAPVRPATAVEDDSKVDARLTDKLLKEAELLAAAAKAAANGDANVDAAAPKVDLIEAERSDTAAISEEAEKLALLATETQEAPEASETPEPEKVFADALPQAPAISPIALKRPADLRARVAKATEVEVASAGNLAAAAASSAVQIQLAADPSEATIRKMWSRIQKANSDILRDRALAVQTTVSGGTTFYRLRIGPFKDGAEARAVCQALKGRGQDCIVARNS